MPTAAIVPKLYGSSHASRLKPLSMGDASAIWLPYFLMKYWMICSRVFFWTSSWRISMRSWIAWPQFSDAHSMSMCRQLPHWQTMLRTSQFSSTPTGLGASAPPPVICPGAVGGARAVGGGGERGRPEAEPQRAARAAGRARRRRSGDGSAHARRHALEQAVGRERDARAHGEQHEPEPDPVDDGVDDDLEHRRALGEIVAAERDVE